MKVRELIKALKKQDPEADVCWQAHDQSEHECDGWVDSVEKGNEAMCDAEGKTSIVVLSW